MILCHTLWASQVAAAADLPEKRLDKRLTAIFVETIERPSASIPRPQAAPARRRPPIASMPTRP